MHLKFCSLASGSSGNCYYIGNDTQGILIDAGIGVRTIKKRLKEINVPLESILGVFVTHDHFDHIASIGVLGEVHHIPIYSTSEVLEGINRCYKVTQKINFCKRPIQKGEPVTIGDFQVEAFPVSHDSSDCVGYTVSYLGKKLTVATDLGYISEEAAQHILLANSFVVEANYDEQILLNNAAYPLFLKERILGKKGHLSNHELAAFLSDNFQEHWQYIFLCHLSKENNTPERAIETIEQKIGNKRYNLWTNCALIALPRTTPTEVFSI
ncbi:MAG: MBL fold metallo-hydrolase [Paludibacteraceae bacterium]|nr:MBL fold metallo-hydrolase [Paludibacteraceae bacterium]MBP6283866.1 MBL fold metallo-hydrolase [Paludibacteraceae bacterium]